MAFVGIPAHIIPWLLEQPQDKLFTVKEKRNRRSLTQNAYYWVLINKLGRVLGLSDTEVHEQMLREYGVCDVMTLLEGVPIHEYFDYFDVFGHGEINGKTYAHVRVYKNSKKMNSKEFSRLLEGLRYECEQQGIDVMTPDEIARMKFVENFGEDK